MKLKRPEPVLSRDVTTTSPLFMLLLELTTLIYTFALSPHSCCSRALVQRNCACEHSRSLVYDKRKVPCYELLLVNSRIFGEAEKIAYAACYKSIYSTSQKYNVFRSCAQTRTRLPTSAWRIASAHVWQPKCNTPKEFAALRLKNIGIYIGHVDDDKVKEQLHSLTVFMRNLIRELHKQNAVGSLLLYLPIVDKAHLIMLFGIIDSLARLGHEYSVMVVTRGTYPSPKTIKERLGERLPFALCQHEWHVKEYERIPEW